MSGLLNLGWPLWVGGVTIVALLLVVLALRMRRRASRMVSEYASKGRAHMNKKRSDHFGHGEPRRDVTRGKSIARVTRDYLDGNLQSHKTGLEKATKLRREGREREAGRELILAHRRQAQKAVELVSLVGIAGRTYVGGFISIRKLDEPRANEWLRRRLSALNKQAPTGEDKPLPLGKRLLYRMTGGPKAGVSYELYLFHKSGVEHYTKMLEQAQSYLKDGRDQDARDLLRHDRDRCVMLSFLDGEGPDPLE